MWVTLKNLTQLRRQWGGLFVMGFTILELTGCTNFRNRTVSVSSLLASNPTNASSLYVITQATVSSSTAGSNAPPLVTLYFDSSKAPQPLTNICAASSSSSATNSLPCQCTFSWTDANTQGSGTVAVKHSVVTQVTQVQTGLLACPAPSVYSTEIPDGTSIVIKVSPGPGNTQNFGNPSYNLIKNLNSASGSFRDFQGRSFMNIARYSCYDIRKRGMSIQSNLQTLTNPTYNLEVRPVPIATKLCVSRITGSGSGAGATSQDGCTNLPLPDFSAQSNYYNLYVRETESGDINPSNGGFTCPLVKEPINSATAQAAQIRAWPLDTTFALSMGRSGDFPIGVVANTKLANSNDPASSSTDCNGGNVATKSGINYGCLGFAAKPNNDGTCSVMKDASGKNIPTFRLRRYIALYPQIFDTNGDYLTEAQPHDTIYVIDRPVQGPNNQLFTMKGPKPCPYSYFDNNNVTGAGRDYYATNNALWEGKNVDNIHLPDTDSPTSCSMALPVLSPDRRTMGITTVNAQNSQAQYRRFYVRPVHAWAPHYEEDTDFKACAPLSNPLRDAPLHLAQLNNATPVAWCSESYPTQNDNVGTLANTSTAVAPVYDPAVRNYNSHSVSNSTSAACSATLPVIPAGYPGAGAANHLGGNSATCDRTVSNGGVISNVRFPLLAPATDTEQALKNDPAFGCTITWDGGGGSIGKSPAGGCCGASISGLPAHLEPGGDGSSACAVPSY